MGETALSVQLKSLRFNHREEGKRQAVVTRYVIHLQHAIGSDTSCRLIHLTDQPGTDALLTGIRQYRYHAYLTSDVGSPAIDNANPTSLDNYPTGQRGRMSVDGDLNGSVVADISAS